MARKVVWTEPAWQDLEVAADFIARDSKNYAATFVQRVNEAAASLAEFAERGQVVPEFGDATIRELLVRPYCQWPTETQHLWPPKTDTYPPVNRGPGHAGRPPLSR